LVPAEELLLAVRPGRARAPATARVLSDGPIRLLEGKTTPVAIRLLGARRVPPSVHIELIEAPEGIALEEVKAEWGRIMLMLRAEPDKTQPGLKGNLIAQSYMERTVGRQGARRKVRVPLFTLPAIPFEVVD